MYLTIATITHYSYSIERSKDIKISQTLEEAKQNLRDELQDQDLIVGENEEDYMGYLHYAKAWDDKQNCEIVWRITEIKLDEYYGICG